MMRPRCGTEGTGSLTLESPNRHPERCFRSDRPSSRVGTPAQTSPVWRPTDQRLPDHLMIDGILCIELCYCFGVGTVDPDTQFLIESRGSMVVILLTFGDISTAVQGRKQAP